jgi:hypothetical protein
MTLVERLKEYISRNNNDDVPVTILVADALEDIQWQAQRIEELKATLIRRDDLIGRMNTHDT